MVRPLSLFVLSLALGATSPVVHGQAASTLTPGTSRDEVIRAHGWPPGRTALGTREIWSYESFRVVLEDGRVVEVSSQAPASKRAPTPTPAPRPPPRTPLPRPDPTPVSPAQLRPLAPTAPASGGTTVQRTPPSPRPVSAPTDTPRPLPLPASRPTPAKAPPPRPTAWDLARPMILITAGFFAIAIAAVVIQIKRRSRSIEERLLNQPPPPPAAATPPPATFEQHIASKLGPAITDTAAPPIAPPPPADPVADAAVFDATLIRSLEWKRFELLVTLYYRATGVRAEDTGPGADGGVDVVLTQPDASRPYAYIQCKAWGSEPVGVSLIRELRGVMATDHIPQGIFSTTSDYTPDARAFAQASAMTLLTTADLVECLNQLPDEARRSIFAAVTAGDYTTPSCPKCERKMVWREQPQFWGCPAYPTCRSSPIYPRKAKV